MKTETARNIFIVGFIGIILIFFVAIYTMGSGVKAKMLEHQSEIEKLKKDSLGHVHQRHEYDRVVKKMKQGR